MSYKVDLLNPFDKGFFGKTLTEVANNTVKIEKPSKLVLDSVDDFVKHFKDACIKTSLERSPMADSFETKAVEDVVGFPNVFSL